MKIVRSLIMLVVKSELSKLLKSVNMEKTDSTLEEFSFISQFFVELKIFPY